jgi:hypothetical protein
MVVLLVVAVFGALQSREELLTVGDGTRGGTGCEEKHTHNASCKEEESYSCSP